mgnify:CR=1 FL=1|jgi:endonuclease/exonuclease/phosphatase family metal-dependent hydrolase
MNVRALQFNVQGLPILWDSADKAKDISSVILALEPLPDAIAFNEMFTRKLEKHTYKLLHDTYPYWTTRANANNSGIFSSGLCIACRHPIVFTASTRYNVCHELDCVMPKGALYVRISPPGFPSGIGLVTTHLQAPGAIRQYTDTRHTQLRHLQEFLTALRRRGEIPQEGMVVLGDVNMEDVTPVEDACTCSAVRTHPDVPTTDHGERIDLALVSGHVRSATAHVLTDVVLSDHFPLVTDIVFDNR